MCVDIINDTKRNIKINKNKRIKLVIILVLLIITSGYKLYIDDGKEFYRGVKEASKEGLVIGYNKE